MKRCSAALACALAASLLVGAADAGASGDRSDGGATRDGGSPRDGGPDAGAPDPDAELIEHLEEIQQMGLLDHLELFDEKGE